MERAEDESVDDRLAANASDRTNDASTDEIKRLKRNALKVMVLIVFLVMIAGTVCGFIDAETLERLTPALTNLAEALKSARDTNLTTEAFGH